MRNPIWIILILGLTSIGLAAQHPRLDSLRQAFELASGEDKMNSFNEWYVECLYIDPSILPAVKAKGNAYLEETKELTNNQKEYVRCTMLKNDAFALTREGKMDEALLLYQAMQEKSEALDEPLKSEILAFIYRGLGFLHATQNLHAESIKNLLLAKDIYVKRDDSLQVSNALAQISQNYKMLDSTETALKFINQSFQFLDKKANPQHYGKNILFKADILNACNQYDATLALLNPNELEQLAEVLPSIFANIMLSKATAMAALKQDKETIYGILADIEPLALSTPDANLTFGFKFARKTIAEKLGDYKLAIQYSNEFSAYKDSLNLVRTDNKFLAAQAKFEDQIKVAEIATLKTEAEYQNKLLMSSFGILALVLAFGFLFFKNVQQKRRATEILAAKEKEVVEGKERLFTNITHELRTPLSLIISPLQELLTKPQEKDNQAKISLALDNSQQLLGLVNQVLDWHSLENNILKNTPATGEFNQVIEQCVARFEPALAAKQIDLSLTQNKQSTFANFDFNKLDKILNNIISNAIKYTLPGGKISVESKVGNQNIQIVISDTGQGISEAEQAAVFNRFNRTEDSNGQKGYGIGLALVKELTNLLNGKIDLQSKQGEGTEVTLSFPFDPVPIDSTLPKVTTRENDKALIYVVEDNFQLRNYITDFLSKNFVVQAFENAELAAQQLQNAHPDVLLLDVMLPGMDGVSFCQQIKSNSDTNHLPVLLLTAQSAPNNKLGALELGADVWMVKPFEVAELKAQLQNLVKIRRNIQAKYGKEIEISFEKKCPKLDNKFLENVLHTVLDHLEDDKFNVERLAQIIGISRFQLSKRIKSYTNKTVVQLIREIRLEKAKTILLETEKNISEVAYDIGFKDPNYFSICFKDFVGASPTEWRKERELDVVKVDM